VNVTSVNTAQGAWTINTSSSYPAYATTVTDPAGKSEQWYYSAWGSSTYNYTDKRGIRHGYSMGAVIGGKGRVTQMRTPNLDGGGGGLTLQNTNYNTSVGMPSQITNERGETTSISYNSQGQPTSVTDPKGQTTGISYASNGLDVASITNANNVTVASYNYNAQHQPTSITDAQNKTTQMTYTAWGAPLTVTDASGQTTSFNYDSSGQLASLSRAGSTLASYTYDEIGRVQTKTDAAGLTLTYQYNNLDKVTKVTYPDGTFSSVEYVCCGMPGVVTDRSGRKSYYDYDPMKRLTRMQDAAGNSVQLDCDGNGSLTRLIDAQGNVTRWVYDEQNRLTQKIYHDGTAESYVYSLGLLAQKTSAKGQTTGYAYDDNGNLTVINYPNMADVSIAYNALDKPASMTDGLGTSSFGYDAMGRLTSVDGPWSNDTVTYSYDELGRRSTLNVPDGAGSDGASYAYDALSRLQSVTSMAGTFGYTYAGNTGMVQQLSLPNGAKTQYSYDGLHQLTQIANTTAANANISNYTYGYDHREVRTYVEQVVGAEPMQRINFGYDTTDQLVSEVSAETPTPDLSQSYSYDAMGNRTGSTQGTGTNAVAASYQSNKLNQYTTINAAWNNGTETSTATLTYDASGNMTQMASVGTSGGSTSDYTFDDADRLTSVVRKDGAGTNEHKSEYVYDGLSRLRVSREYSWNNGAWVAVTGGEKRRVYDGMNVVQERDDVNAVKAFYTHGQGVGGGIGGLLSRSTAMGHFYYHYDGRGNVVQMTDANQNTVASYKYSAFGTLIASSGAQAVDNPYRFSTKEFYGATGLYDYGYRFYLPALGKWIARDHIQEEGGFNLYEFVSNEPLDKADMRGLWTFCIGLGASAMGGVNIAVKGSVSKKICFGYGPCGWSVGEIRTVYVGAGVGYGVGWGIGGVVEISDAETVDDLGGVGGNVDTDFVFGPVGGGVSSGVGGMGTPCMYGSVGGTVGIFGPPDLMFIGVTGGPTSSVGWSAGAKSRCKNGGSCGKPTPSLTY
jgi:RHS repeat-associated protein